jgi:hypothetical protein
VQPLTNMHESFASRPCMSFPFARAARVPRRSPQGTSTWKTHLPAT